MTELILEQICNRIAKNFYNRNRVLCASASYGVDDLKQETKLYAWKMWEKHRDLDKEHLSKLVSKSASWRLKSLRKYVMLAKAKLELKNFHSGEINYNNISYTKNKGKHQKYFNLRKKMPYTLEMIMDDLTNVCNKRQCYILYEKIVNGKTFDKIGKELNICRNGVKWHFDEALKNINEKYLKIFSFENENKKNIALQK